MHLRRHALIAGMALLFGASQSPPASAEEDVMFSAKESIKSALVARINAETDRLDVATWYLSQREVTQAIINRHKAGVIVRVLGDRVGIFENDVNTKREFTYLATNGVPIRLRYNPRYVVQPIHWKASIFVGQGKVEFGSANYTGYELAPFSATNYHDEIALFSDDPALVNAFKTRFDQYWADTTYFKDWNEAYKLETGSEFPVQLSINRARREPDYPMPSSMAWAQGPEFNNKLIAEINKEPLNGAIDVTIFRLSSTGITDALVNRFKAGVPVRVLLETSEYSRKTWPEFELTRARVDTLWAAGIPIKKRVHAGLMHMKTLITSAVATIASSNFTNNWQRDHNYFLPSLTKGALHQEIRSRFNAMWNDPAAFGTFTPLAPAAATLVGPANGTTGVTRTPTFTWNRAPWAVAYDVCVWKSGSPMQCTRKAAVLTDNPPKTYSLPWGSTLAGGTTHYWRVVSLTNANKKASSATWSFTTTGSSSASSAATQTPFGGSPAALPGTVQAENFDNGGQGVAYYDTASANSGGAYRSTGVDIEVTSDTGGGYNVGWMTASEWLEYTVNIANAGTYTLQVRAAAPSAGGTFRVEFGGANKTGSLTIPATGGWQKWTTISKTVVLSAGQQIMRFVAQANGAGGVFGNINWIRVQ